MSKYPLTQVSVPPLSGDRGHHGTGDISDAKNMVVPASVGRDVNTQLDFTFKHYEITVMAFEIQAKVAPNWFGAAFRKGINSFDAVNIFFHPHPTKEMSPTTYFARAGDWPKLFRYAEMLGSQVSMATPANNQIIVVPFFNNASWGNTGIFAPNWHEIVADIVTAVWTETHTTRSPGQPASTLKLSGVNGWTLMKNIVLSDFSAGRYPMLAFLAQASDRSGFLREIWDFDGVGPLIPNFTTVRVIRYDGRRISNRDPFTFHVPPERWLGFHHKVVPSVHANIPDMLGWHAATLSGVGR